MGLGACWLYRRIPPVMALGSVVVLSPYWKLDEQQEDQVTPREVAPGAPSHFGPETCFAGYG